MLAALTVLRETLSAVGARLVLAPHDAVLIEAPENAVEQVRELIRRAFDRAVTAVVGEVPVRLRIGDGQDWWEAEMNADARELELVGPCYYEVTQQEMLEAVWGDLAELSA